jgi:hypothetical protein
MTRQLTLIPARKTWQLDAQTREIGRRVWLRRAQRWLRTSPAMPTGARPPDP